MKNHSGAKHGKIKRLTSLFRTGFIPHKENDFRPHLLREEAVLGLTVLIVSLFIASHFNFNSQENFSAAVLPAVLVDLTNSDRSTTDIPTLTINPLLEEAARQKAQDMATKGYFAHTSPEGRTPWYWLTNVDYSFSYAGENLAMGFFESADVNQAWLNSAGHKQNILNKNFTEIGIATAYGLYNGVETTFVVQMFGRPPIIKLVQPIVEASIPPTSIPATPPKSESVKPIVLAPQVKKPVVQSEPESVTVQSATTEMFVTTETKNTEATDVLKTSPTPPYASRLNRLLSTPRTMLNYLYLILAGIIGISLFSALFIKFEKQHPKHVLYALTLLALIVSLTYLNRSFVFAHVLII